MASIEKSYLTIWNYSVKKWSARRELAEVEKISLAKRDAELFLSALTNSQAPNKALKTAFKEYEKQTRK